MKGIFMIDRLVDILHSGNHSLVIDNGALHTYDGRGVSDLYRLYTTEPQSLNGAMVADKVVGKGAAALMALSGIKQLHADVISKPALDLLKTENISVGYDKLVDNIINRKGTGICPVETMCLECKTAEDCLPKITQFLSVILKTKN